MDNVTIEHVSYNYATAILFKRGTPVISHIKSADNLFIVGSLLLNLLSGRVGKSNPDSVIVMSSGLLKVNLDWETRFIIKSLRYTLEMWSLNVGIYWAISLFIKSFHLIFHLYISVLYHDGGFYYNAHSYKVHSLW